MLSPSLLLNNTTLSPPSIKRLSSPDLNFFSSPVRKSHGNLLRCRVLSSSSRFDYDLYDLLGIDSSCDQWEIKKAYRLLQKRCHPDIAGPAGHDMAIILNEAYSLLSDPASRFIYDKEQSKSTEFKGYSGKPLYSTWFGSEGEQRAIFVDELKCVGCLKCALLAEKTFAIESVYGRARVVAQWADSEHKINDAIQACPVNCISMVERSKLAALEFLMSKQPRGNVQVGVGNAVGTRVTNIFVDANKFDTKFSELKEKARRGDSKETDLQRETRISAFHAIRLITNWWYWQPPSPTAPKPLTFPKLLPQNSTLPNTQKLQEAASRRRRQQTGESSGSPRHDPSNYKYSDDEYWTLTPILQSPPQYSNSESLATTSSKATSSAPPLSHKAAEEQSRDTVALRNPFSSNIPIVISMFGASIAGLEGGGSMGGGGLKEHIGGAAALEVVNSSLLQVFLAGVTWYIIGLVLVGLIDVFGRTLYRGE